MPEKTGEVQAFRFDQDSIKEMKPIYKSILQNLGIKNPDERMSTMIASIPDEEKNGVMFNKIVSSLFTNDEERKEKASKAFEEIKDDPSISPYVKAYIAEMSGDYIPYDTVLTSARMVGGETGKGGKSLQMGCGEGKTGVLSMAAYSILMQDKTKQVFLTSSTENLAAEALDKIEFYDKVGLASEVVLVDSKGITKPVFDDKGKIKRDEEGKIVLETINFEKKNPAVVKKLLKEAYSSRLVISDNVTLMQDAMKGYLEEPTADNKRELLADEADFVLLDSYRPLQRTAEMTEEEMKNAVAQRKIAYDILKKVKAQMPEGLFVKDDSSQYVDFTQKGRELVVEAVRRAQKIDRMDPNTVYDYVYDALVVDTVYKENRDYQILNNGKKIVSEDRASGVGIDLPEGVRQALEIKLQKEGKYTGEISPERKALDTLNTQSFFKKFFNGTKHFISGTLGVDSKAIVEELKHFDVSKDEGDIYEAPPKEKRSRDDQPRRFCKTPQGKRNAIIKNALKEIEAGRPVLIGTVSEEEINALKEVLAKRHSEKTNGIRVLEFTAASEEIFKQDKENLKSTEFKQKYGVDKKQYKDYKTLIKNESGKAGTITFGTSILGRGTTIKTSKDIDKSGGIHVIIDGLHETSSRNQEQYKARTARGDNNGSTKEFFCAEDIPEEVRRDSYDGMRPDEIYEEVYERIDARTSGIRNYVVQFVEKTIEKLEEIDKTKGMSPEHKNQAKALLTQRAFSIKNRACGVSDKFQTNIQEYEREIEAYADLYRAKYMVTDERYYTAGKRFDETKWLEENGYEDIARTHMPFKKTRENEIFRNSGIKVAKIKKEAIQEGKEESKKTPKPTPEKSKKTVKKVAPNVQPIADNKVVEYFKQQAVELVVDKSFRVAENYVGATGSTYEIQSTDQEEFKSDTGKTQFEDNGERTSSEGEIDGVESAINIGGINEMFHASKDIWAISWTKVKETYGIMKDITISIMRDKFDKKIEKSEVADESR